LPSERDREGDYGLIGIIALIIGIGLGLVLRPSVPEVIAPYLPIAVVAALDAVFGGLRAYLENIFDAKVFVISFVFNVLVAALIVYVGDQLGVGTQLSTAIIVVLGIRIFGNAAALRRKLFGA
jgi:small basic protein